MKILGTILGILICFSPAVTFAHYVEMRITNSGFEPERLEIHPGETVFFVNESDDEHWVASDEHPTHTVYPGSDIRSCGTEKEFEIFDSCRGLRPGEKYRFTFYKPGVWELHDHLNSSVGATITVTGTSTENGGNLSRSSLSLAGKISAFLLGKYYALFPSRSESRLNELNLIRIATRDDDLEYWMRVFGYKILFDKLVQDAYDPTQRLSTPDEQNKVTECHLTAHFAGRMAYKLYGFDMLAASASDTRCFFGFYHGVIEMALGAGSTDVTVSDLAEQCEKYDAEPIRRALCYHAIGHGLTIYHDFDVPSAIRKCAEFSRSVAGKQMCYNGVFMENAFATGGIGASGHASSWRDPARPDLPCDLQDLSDDLDIQRTCYFNQPFIWWSHQGGVYVPTAIEGCERAPQAVRRICYNGIGFNMSIAWGKTLRDEDIVENCNKIPTASYRSECLVGAILTRSMFWGDFKGFTNPTLCTALKIDDPARCDAFVRGQLTWLDEK